jgi:uncharacterized protein YqhQ
MATFYYGGQAVVEGVMLRGRKQATVVVRKRTGRCVSRSELLPGSLYRNRIARLPFIRGLVALWEMLILGTRMMLFSAGIQADLDPEREVSGRVVAVMITVSLAFAIGLFFVAPLLLTRTTGGFLHGPLASNIVEGVVRLALFIGYLALVGRLGQMYRVFQYHGAEHKTINAFESGAELTPRSVQRFSTVHIRCGTAFLLWVVVISIFVFALLGHPPILLGALARIVLVPLIAAVSYEILHIALVRAVVQPGLWLQRLTTREPSDDQVTVAIMALQEVLAADGIGVPVRAVPVGMSEGLAAADAAG